MTRSSALGAVEWENESAWAEDVSTYTYRADILDRVDVSGLTHAKVPSARVVQYRNDYVMPYRGTMGGSFTTKLALTGFGSGTSGTLSTVAQTSRLLGYVIGNRAYSSTTGTTISGTGSSATSLNVAAASGFSAGSLLSVGTKGDGLGDGQWAAVSSHGTSTIALLTALPAAPTTNGHVVYTGDMVYPSESPSSSTITSLRFRLLTANLQIEAHGCFPTAISWEGLNPGEFPTVTITWGVSWWEYVSETFPSAVSADNFVPAVCAAGSVFMNAVGTATRAVKSVRSFTIDHQLGIVPVMGPGGVGEFQHIVGAYRTPDTVTVSYTLDSQAASATPTEPGLWDSDTQGYHLLYSLNGAASGKRVAFYFPNLKYVDEKPSQIDASGINGLRTTLRACTGGTTTSDLTLSAYRLCMA